MISNDRKSSVEYLLFFETPLVFLPMSGGPGEKGEIGPQGPAGPAGLPGALGQQGVKGQ